MAKKHYIIPIFVPHQGCHHNCVFCNQNKITGSSLEANWESTKSIIENHLKTIPRDEVTIEISFFGGTFTAIDMEKQRELLAVAYQYKKTGQINFIRLSTRPDYINKEILDNLKAYSVDIIELGVQSLDNQVLISSGRGHLEEDVIRASKLVKEYGFTLGLQIMLGLPKDTYEKDLATLNKVVKLSPEMVRVYPALVIKDTPMEKMLYEKTYMPYTLNQAIEISKVMYIAFIANNIKILRMGLLATDEINIGKEIIAGPFHPAFRELVEGSIINDMLRENISKYAKNIIIRINEKDISKLYCNSKKYFKETKAYFNESNIKVVIEKNIEKGKIIIEEDLNNKELSFFKYISNKYVEGNLN